MLEADVADSLGQPVEPVELQTDLGRSLAEVLTAGILPFVSLREVRREVGADVIVVIVVAELPQHPVVDIRRSEPIAIRLRDMEDRTPEILALREDFPADHVHLNVTEADCPWPSLCLYEETWEELRLLLTGPGLLGRIQEWLSLSARGNLHDPDQQLEPFVSPFALPLVLPPSQNTEEPSNRLWIEARGDERHTVYVASSAGGPGPGALIAFSYETGSAKQAALRRHPTDLSALHELLKPLGFDLVARLRAGLLDLKHAHEEFETSTASLRPILVFNVPLVRRDGGNPESGQVFSYVVNTTIRDLGKALGIWDTIDGNLGLLLTMDESARGEGLDLLPVRPVFDITPEDASALSGVEGRHLNLTAVGVGAIGSQVIVNLARSGLGRWTLIDDDSLLPHNLVRHALLRPAIGFPKAEGMAHLLASLASAGPPARALVSDVLDGNNAEIAEALRASDMVLDFSATATVSRFLALDAEGVARCMALFLNPTGTDLVALVEDRERRIGLDALEMQYYRALVREPRLDGHMRDPTGRARYGTSCRDVTMCIPQDQVAVAAGIGARAVRTFSESPEPRLCIWRMAPDLSVAGLSFPIQPVAEWECGRWTVIADQWLLQHLADMRRRRLPSETGGVLLGFHDVRRMRLYIADALPAPPDSTERPVYFDRGCIGLREHVQEAVRLTGKALSYVGEWHSHPGRSTKPSQQDGQVLQFLSSHMARDGLPALMVIVANSTIDVFVDSLNAGRRKARN